MADKDWWETTDGDECLINRLQTYDKNHFKNNDKSVKKKINSTCETSLHTLSHQRGSELEIKNDNLSQRIVTDDKHKNFETQFTKKTNNEKLESMSSIDYSNQSTLNLNKVNNKNKLDDRLEKIKELAELHLNVDFKSKVNTMYFEKHNTNLPGAWLKTLRFSVSVQNNSEKYADFNSNTIENLLEIPKIENIQDFISLDEKKNIEKISNQNVIIESNHMLNDPKLIKNSTEKNTAKHLELNINRVFQNQKDTTNIHQNTPVKLEIVKNSSNGNFLMKPSDFLNVSKFSSSIPQKENDFSFQLQSKLLNIGPKESNLNTLKNEFRVIIHSCASLSEIWGNSIDENTGDLTELSNEMALFYISETPENLPVQENFFYALYDGCWHRVKCLKTNGTIATVFFIDRGYRKTYPVEKLYKLNYNFCVLPCQAIRMTLTGLDFFSECDNMFKILYDLLHEKIFYAKIDHLKANENCLSVTLYYKKELLTNVNEIIKKEISNYSSIDKSVKIIQQEFKNIEDFNAVQFSPNTKQQCPIPGLSVTANSFEPREKYIVDECSLKNLSKMKEKMCENNSDDAIDSQEKKTVESTKTEAIHQSFRLKHPYVPQDYTYFDISVVKVHSPSHFVVQLLREKTNKLKKMMNELAAACIAYDGPKLIKKNFQRGILYACKSNEHDLMWYRVYVTKIINDKVCNVYFCDFGVYKKIHIGNLVPLPEKFYELPYQAITAELWGITPRFGEWSKSDRDGFKELISAKNFVCVARKKKNFNKFSDKTFKEEIEFVYELELIDTSTDDDINISKLLVKEGKALKK